jgi:hypothetical protein
MAATSTTPADDQPTTMTLYAGRPDVTPQHEVSAAIMFAKNELEVCNRGTNGCEKR